MNESNYTQCFQQLGLKENILAVANIIIKLHTAKSETLFFMSASTIRLGAPERSSGSQALPQPSPPSQKRLPLPWGYPLQRSHVPPSILSAFEQVLLWCLKYTHAQGFCNKTLPLSQLRPLTGPQRGLERGSQRATCKSALQSVKIQQSLWWGLFEEHNSFCPPSFPQGLRDAPAVDLSVVLNSAVYRSGSEPGLPGHPEKSSCLFWVAQQSTDSFQPSPSPFLPLGTLSQCEVH